MLQPILEALSSADFDTAVSTARETIERYPEMADAYHLLAVAEGSLGQFESALTHVDRAISLAPDNSAFHVTRGALLARHSSADAARGALQEAVSVDPNAFLAYVSLAHLAIARGDFSDAQQQTARAARIDPDATDVLILQGIDAQSQGNLDAASALFSAAVNQAPQSALAQARLGLCFLAQGRHAFAEQSLRNALAIQPDNVSLRRALIRALAEQGRPTEALPELDYLVSHLPNDPGLLEMRAGLLMEMGRATDAANDFIALLELVPDQPQAIVRAVQAYCILGRQADAAALLEQRLAKQPTSDELWSLRLGIEKPDVRVAAEVTERWHAVSPDSAGANEAMAQLAELRGQSAQAEAHADKALASEPQRGAAQLVKLRAELRNAPDAARARTRRLVDQATQSEARRVSLHWHGLALDRCERFSDASTCWQEMWAHNQSALPLPLSRPVNGNEPDPGATSPALFVWTLPGSPSEELIPALSHNDSHVLMPDRYSRVSRLDGLDPFRQVPQQGPALGSYAAWRAAIEVLGQDPQHIIDWLPHWDLALNEQFPGSQVIALVRDPRDLLLNWLAFGCPQTYGCNDVLVAAMWLQQVLAPLLALREQHPERVLLLRGEHVTTDRKGTIERISRFASVRFNDGALNARSITYSSGRMRSGFAPGHWQAYAQVLAGPFAQLNALAEQLGYPLEPATT